MSESESQSSGSVPSTLQNQAECDKEDRWPSTLGSKRPQGKVSFEPGPTGRTRLSQVEVAVSDSRPVQAARPWKGRATINSHSIL